VFIPQLSRVSRGDDRELLLWDEHSGADGERSFLLAADDHSERGAPTLYNYLDKLRKNKSLLEGTRLLYVGATRAVRRLVLSASLTVDGASGEPRAPAARSLLGAIWPTFRQQMRLHEPDAAPAATSPAVAPTRVLRLRAPVAGIGESPTPARTDTSGSNIPERANNYRERCIGTVVHMALDELSRRDTLPAEPDGRDRERSRATLAGLGLWGTALEEALAAVEQSLRTTLAAAGPGRWILSNGHHQARSEWALTCVNPVTGRIDDLVIDRTFVDCDSGIRWLIDYKNSRPEPGETLDEFFSRQAGVYREQLLRYRHALRELAHEPLRCALYFTALGQLYPLEELELATAG